MRASLLLPALLSMALAWSQPAAAVEPDEILPDARLEARARALSADLRCLVCQNQSIDDSNAPLARDLRLLVRERLMSGDSDAEVRGFVVSRYGEFVLLRPSLSASTVLLWATPLLILIGAAAFIVRGLRGRPAGPRTPSPLDAEEQARLAAILVEQPADVAARPGRRAHEAD